MKVLKYTNKNYSKNFEIQCKRSYDYIKNNKDKHCIYYAFHLRLCNKLFKWKFKK